MPTYLQPVEIPERCFLGEVLLWVAFQRLPITLYYEGKELRETFQAGRMAVEVPEWEISEEETKRANLPPDPAYIALIEERSTLSPDFYDKLLKSYDPTPAERARVLEERAAAEIYQRECDAWKRLYHQAIEYPTSRIFVAFKGGQLRAVGRLLPGCNEQEAGELLERDDKDVYDFPVVEISPSFWSLSGIDFRSSGAGNGSTYYCHVSCKTADMMSIFPGEREQVNGIERVGDSFVLNEVSHKPPPSPSKRGRPAYPWEPFHVEVAALLLRGELPSKKEAAIQHFQTWFEFELGVEPSRAAIGEKLKPYYDKFGRRGGQKISG